MFTTLIDRILCPKRTSTTFKFMSLKIENIYQILRYVLVQLFSYRKISKW